MALLVGVAVGLWLRWSADSLLYRASSIQLPFPLANRTTHVWLEEQKLLVLQATGGGGTKAIQVDLQTGQTNYVAGIGAALESVSKTNDFVLVDMSPDAQWLLLLTRNGTNQHLVAVSADGIQHRSCRLEPGYVGFAWLPGSRRWVTIMPKGQSGRAVVHSVDSTLTWEFSTTLPANVNPVGATGDGHILLAWPNLTNGNELVLAKMNPTNFSFVGAPALAGLSHEISASYTDLQLTRKGDRLAGIATRAEGVLEEVMSHFGWDRPSPMMIWHSKPDGTDWHSLGWVSDGDLIQEVRFTPDGRHLSFVRRTPTNGLTLWRVPVH